MSELMRRPTKKEVEEQLHDPITFSVVYNFRKLMNNSKDLEINFLRQDFDNWKLITRRLINHGKFVLLSLELERIAEEVADNQWTDFKIPELKEKSKQISIDPTTRLIKDKIKITEIAEKYGLKVRGEKAICPFHNDTNPSLSFSNEKGVFHCFGCNVKGDIITFVRMMEDLKNGR